MFEYLNIRLKRGENNRNLVLLKSVWNCFSASEHFNMIKIKVEIHFIHIYRLY